MATSGGGFAASGLLQGFAQAYNSAYQRRTQQDLEQRHQLASFLISAMPNMRPEAQQEASQRLLSIYSTPIGKKLDKKLADFSTLGQAGMQGQPTGAQAQGGMENMVGATQQAPLPMGQAPGIAGPPQNQAPAPNIPAPPAYSPYLSPEERNQQEQVRIAGIEKAKTEADLHAKVGVFSQQYQQALSQGLSPSDAMLHARAMIGGAMPASLLMPTLRPEDWTDQQGNAVRLNFNTKTGERTDQNHKPVDTSDLKPGKAPMSPKNPSDPLWQITKQLNPGMDTNSPEFAQKWAAMRMSEKSDPGVNRMRILLQRSYHPFNDAAGNTVGWVNPVTRQVTLGEDIPGLQQTLAQSGGVIPPKPPPNVVGMAVAAGTMLQHMPEIRNEIIAAKDKLGPAAGRWNEYMTGKVGANDPQFKTLRTNMELLHTRLMQAHVGMAGSDKMMEHFSGLIDAGKDSPENMLAAWDVINSYLETYRGMSPHAAGGGALKNTPPPKTTVQPPGVTHKKSLSAYEQP